MFPNMGHPCGPGGRRRFLASVLRRWRKINRIERSGRRKSERYEVNAMISGLLEVLCCCLSSLLHIYKGSAILTSQNTLHFLY